MKSKLSKNLAKPLFSIIALFAVFSNVFGSNPTLNIQGVIRTETNAAVSDGTYSIAFHLYDAATGGNELWNETQSSIHVTNGVYSTQLGLVKSLGTLAFDKAYFIAIAVNGGSISSPRIPLSIAPQALAVAGENNIFPGSGNVLIGKNVNDVEVADNKLEVRNGNIEIQNDEQDAQIRFHDPGNAWMYIGTDKSDNNALKIGSGTTVGANDFFRVDREGDVTINNDLILNNIIRQDMSSTDYDLWIQGGSASSGDGRNLAILGDVYNTNDKLIVNWNGEYKEGVDVQSNLNVRGNLTINSSAPILIRKYRSNNSTFNAYGRTPTGVSASSWTATIVGVHIEGDWEEKNAGADMLRFKMLVVNGTWHIEFYVRHNSLQYGEVDVMFIRNGLVNDQRF